MDSAIFRICVILLLFFVTYLYANKWIALFLIFSISSQFVFVNKITGLNLYGSLYFPEIDAFIISVNIIVGVLFYFILVTSITNSDFIDNLIIMFICGIGITVCFLVSFTNILNYNSNELSAFFALCLPAFFKKKWCFLIPVIIWGLILAESCCGFIASIIGIVFVSFFTLNLQFFLGLLIASIIGFLLYLLFIDIPTISVRLKLWLELLKEYKNCWVFGAGLGGLKWITLKNKVFMFIDANGKFWWRKASNEYIHALLENGIFFIIILVGYGINIIKRVIRRDLYLTLSAILIITILSFFTYLFHNGFLAMLSLTWLALFERQLKRKEAFNE